MFTADMAVHNFVGDSFRGATWIKFAQWRRSGWGEVINGGFGLLIDGSAESERKLLSILDWDVNNGITRRAWARMKELFLQSNEQWLNPKLRSYLPNLLQTTSLTRSRC